jgi:hypothetical protein
MKRLKNRLITTTEFIKHLEQSKCFFRAQKGGADVYLGMGINRLWVVGIFVVNLYYSGCDQRDN